MCYGLMRLQFQNVHLVQKQHFASQKEPYTHSEVWWWQYYALWLLSFCWNWGFSQGGGNYYQFQTLPARARQYGTKKIVTFYCSCPFIRPVL